MPRKSSDYKPYSPFFAQWHAVKYVRDRKEQERIPHIHYYICGHNILSIDVTKLWDNASQHVATCHGEIKFLQGV